ncbi:hypothetical protein ATO8_05486 [Roseivivax marinus]|uniref:Uncharacterized protein n=1 Tax=Roseivivax marinus TaxID=1379903 RepID=W4HMX7_9RHOB|nr:Ig-like domain-containing protein [Roseivivax marinus]ETW13456.1 hypothetical protein ATO8_05486 [Roseivivax marinus]
MKTIDFVVRPRVGAVERGVVGDDATGFAISGRPGAEMSLNLRQADLRGFDRSGDDLLITLADGRVIVVEDYFGSEGTLYLSADRALYEVSFDEAAGGVLLAQYEHVTTGEKWSPSDALVFYGAPQVEVVEAAATGDDDVSMMATGLLGLGGLGSGVGLGAAGLGGAALLGAGLQGGDDDKDDDETSEDEGEGGRTSTGWPETDTGGEETASDNGNDGETPSTSDEEETAGGTAGGGGSAKDETSETPEPSGDTPGGGGTTRVVPTIDDADVPIRIAQADTPRIVISGDAEPGATVTVTIGDETQTTVATENARYEVVFEGDSFPPDGDHVARVTVVEEGGPATDLARPDILIDVTPPPLEITEGTDAVGHVVNAEDQSDGVRIAGTSEAGASVTVTVGGASHETVADAEGGWSVVISETVIVAGTYSEPVTVIASDAIGNSTRIADAVVVDTETSVSIHDDAVEGDGVVNAAERSDGVTLTGAGEPGATVVVEMNGASRTVTVAADGSWAVDFDATDLPEGEQIVTIRATAIDAAGNTETAEGEIDVDTLVRNFAIDGGIGGADGVVNAAERAAGLTVTGTTEPGATVTLSLNGTTAEAEVAADGSWTATFPSGGVPRGELTATLDATSTDRAGNTETVTRAVVIDTVAGTLTIDPDPVESDDIVNAAEASDGVVLTGTSDPGAVVTVTLAGVAQEVTTGADGAWTATFAADKVAPGTYDAEITARITDAAGNSLTRTDSVRVDTEVENFGITAQPLEGDDVVNAAERADGIILTGTTEVGATVLVTLGGVTKPAIVEADGSWTASFAPSELPRGTYDTVAEVTTTDLAGNSATASHSFRVDTEVSPLTLDSETVTGDGTVNAAEARAGITVGGTVEAGSSVSVSFAGGSYAASVGADGTWTVDIPAAGIPRGELSVPITVEATDAAGNTRSVTESIEIDTVAPDAPNVESYTRDHTGLRGISIETTDAEVSIGHVTGDTSIDPVQAVSVDIPILNETAFAFGEVVPDGSHLVITAADDAGNVAGTYLVVDDTTTSDVAMTDTLADTLARFEIGTIDLQFAEDSALSITETQLAALTGEGHDTLTVRGGVDDDVTATGAVTTGTETEADGQGLNVYALGDGTLKIEDDITHVVI